MGESENFSAEDLVDNCRRLLDDLENILKRLELPDGPKLTSGFLEVIGSSAGIKFKDKNEATFTKITLEKSINKIMKIQREIYSLPYAIVNRMESISEVIIPIRSEDDEIDLVPRRDAHRSYVNLVGALLEEFKDELRRVNFERNNKWSGPGPSPDIEAREIALYIAKLYMKLRNGNLPKHSTDSITDGPSTIFSKVVDDVFKLMGISVGFRSPCEHAVEATEQGKI